VKVELSELERDALAEAFNLSLGQAAASFADIVNEEIQVSVPQVEIILRQELMLRLGSAGQPDQDESLCAISQTFRSADEQIAAEALLLFPERGGLEIVRRMLGESSTPLEQITELEQDALGEIGNIIINACMNSLSDVFDVEMVGTLPSVSRFDLQELFDDKDGNMHVLVAQIGMRLSTQDITGHMLILMDLPSLRSVIDRIQVFFGLNAG